MAAPTARPKPWRPLLALLVIIIGLAVWTFWPGQESTPRLGLDLQGGTQVILIPNQAEGTAEITDDQLQQTALGSDIPYQVFLMIPFILSILALVLMSRRANVPAALMVPYNRGER